MRVAYVLPLAVIGLAVAHAGYLSLFAFGRCTAQAEDPGEPRDVTCTTEVSAPALVITALLAAAGLGVALDQCLLAWPAATLAMGIIVLLGLSVGGVLLAHGLA